MISLASLKKSNDRLLLCDATQSNGMKLGRGSSEAGMVIRLFERSNAKTKKQKVVIMFKLIAFLVCSVLVFAVFCGLANAYHWDWAFKVFTEIEGVKVTYSYFVGLIVMGLLGAAFYKD